MSKLAKKAKEIPQENLYIALLDDDPECSCRPHYLYSFSADYKLPDENIFITDNIKKFIAFSDNHRNAVLFCDPGSLGDTSCYGADFKEDRIMAKWLKENPSKVLYIPFLLPPNEYSFKTFEMKNNVVFFGTEFQWEINQILYEWLFKHNPLALFIDEFALDCAHDAYIKGLKEPLLTKICERFGVNGRTIADRKKAIDNYYLKVWKNEMKKRGVKGY